MKTLQDLRRISSPKTQIEMRPGEYLMDIINEINALPEAEKPTVENPLTIHFYNHSKTIDWDRFTEQIHWPQHVYLNFVGEINWWSNICYPSMGFDEGLLSQNPTDKLFIGFSFNRENNDSPIKVSGLPNDLGMIYFGGLDDNWLEYGDWSDVVLDDIPDLAHFRVNGDKADDVKNDALYKMINRAAVDVTPDFRFCNMVGKRLSYAYFYSANCQGAYFYSANCQGAQFYSANCQGVYFYSANCQGAQFYLANCQGAQFYSANCQAAYFYSANCQGTNFNSANCQGAQFYSANCQAANFNSANCQGANFYSANCQDTNFNSANCQGAYFYSANLKNSNWSNVVSITNAKFHGADLTGATNLPERINTKAKFIAECGAGNVNAQTIWIDGTSILA